MRPMALHLVAFTLATAPILAHAQGTGMPAEIDKLFARLDQLGRSAAKDARFVELVFDDGSEPAWLVAEDESAVTVLRDDLLAWTFLKNAPTRVPASWHPVDRRLKGVKEKDFDAFCQEVAARQEEPPEMRLRGPGPSYKVLVAHAAWKKGLRQTCESILTGAPGFRHDKSAFVQAVTEDLAWLHYLRGVNLLMYADRSEVLPHLRLARELAPDSESGKAATELLAQLERMTARKAQSPASSPAGIEAMPSDQRAAAYIDALKDLSCPQLSQPGSIMPYVTLRGDQPSEDTPSAHLKRMGYSAVPALISALEDDTPTRTVYHWRDFARSRLVWRVSDFAWHVLRDIAEREFGDERVVGFTFSSMDPEKRREVVDEVRRWYEKTKDSSPDDRVMAAFSSERFEDWVKAAKQLARQKDRRPVPILIEKLASVRDFDKGELCETIALFGDQAAVEPIRGVLKSAAEPSDRMRAAIALWKLGDKSGLPDAIEYVLAEKQPYGGWDTPVWYLALSDSEEAAAALKKVVTSAKPQRAGEVVAFITAGLTGDLWSERREPVGSARLAEVLAAGLERDEETGMTINNVRLRIKDQAALGLVVMRDGAESGSGGRFVRVNPQIFDHLQPDVAKRDSQIAAIKKWYEENRQKIGWDPTKFRLTLSGKGGGP